MRFDKIEMHTLEKHEKLPARKSSIQMRLIFVKYSQRRDSTTMRLMISVAEVDAAFSTIKILITIHLCVKKFEYV